MVSSQKQLADASEAVTRQEPLKLKGNSHTRKVKTAVHVAGLLTLSAFLALCYLTTQLLTLVPMGTRL